MNWLIYINLAIFGISVLGWILFKVGVKYPEFISPIRVNFSIRLLIICLAIAPIAINFILIEEEELKVVSSHMEHKNMVTEGQFFTEEKSTIKDESNQDFMSYLNILLLIWGLGSSLFLIKFSQGLFKLHKITKEVFLYKKYKGVRIYLADNVDVPFAFWLPGKACIVLPTYLIDKPELLNLALAHEVQHHKHGDTKWIHLYSMLNIFFFWNPFLKLFEWVSNEIQEMACDEALIGRKELSFHEYGGCLIEVALHSLGTHRLPVGTTGLTLSVSGEKLKRRIIVMKRYHYKESKIAKGFVFLIILTMSATVAYASRDFLSGEKITLIQAQDLVKEASRETSFPIEINEKILEQLNVYLGTETGRAYIKNALKRKSEYEKIFRDKFTQYHAPEELLAVALMESGFKNLPERYNRMNCAGIWQFIPGTARSYGLMVNDSKDERLNVSKETDAALRLLGALNLRFMDWKLAIIAYNAGESKLQKGIDTTGSRDAWKLIDEGYAGDEGYLAKVMAGVLILKNSHLIN